MLGGRTGLRSEAELHPGAPRRATCPFRCPQDGQGKPIPDVLLMELLPGWLSLCQTRVPSAGTTPQLSSQLESTRAARKVPNVIPLIILKPLVSSLKYLAFNILLLLLTSSY